jgi:hypothetical protein
LQYSQFQSGQHIGPIFKGQESSSFVSVCLCTSLDFITGSREWHALFDQSCPSPLCFVMHVPRWTRASTSSIVSPVFISFPRCLSHLYLPLFCFIYIKR